MDEGVARSLGARARMPVAQTGPGWKDFTVWDVARDDGDTMLTCFDGTAPTTFRFETGQAIALLLALLEHGSAAAAEVPASVTGDDGTREFRFTRGTLTWKPGRLGE